MSLLDPFPRLFNIEENLFFPASITIADTSLYLVLSVGDDSRIEIGAINECKYKDPTMLPHIQNI
jgi:hypothetical protein